MKAPLKARLSDIVRICAKASFTATALGLCLAVIEGLLPLFSTLATAAFIDSAIASIQGTGAYDKVVQGILFVVIVLACQWTAGQFFGLCQRRVQIRLRDTYRASLTEKCARMEYRHIEDANTWDLIGRVMTKPDEQLSGGFGEIRTAITLVLNVLSLIVLLLVQVWWAALVIVMFSVPLMRLAIQSGKANYQAQRDTERAERKQKYLLETLISREAAEERALFGYADGMAEDFMNEFQKAYRVRFKVMLKWFIKSKLGGLIFSLVSILIAAALLQPVLTGALTVGMFMSLINASFNMVNTIAWTVSYIFDQFAKRKEYLKDYMSFSALSETEKALDAPKDPPLRFDSLELKNVRFTYPGTDRCILSGLTLSIRAGEHIALVGVNGAGKTTLTKLITGLYGEYEGSILLNGRELRTFDQDELKSLYALVFQDFARYQIPFKDDITLGFAAREKKLNEAITSLELTDTVNALKDKLETPLGKLHENGQDLSGGQWQRVAIARALVSPAPIRILDEPTAALDPISESNIYSQFKRMSENTTTLFISHRLGSTKLADRIYVIADGAVLEMGNHDELMAENGLYAEMFEAQRSWYQ